MLDRLQAASEVEFMADFAQQLPLTVIAKLIGVPDKMAHTLRVWTDALATFFGNPNRTMEQTEAAQTAVVRLTEYFRQAVADRRRNRGNDLISLLLQIEDRGDVLTEEELYAQCVMLMFAGHETTRNLLGNGLLTLLRNAQATETFRQGAGDVRSAVEELLRFESPVQFLTRQAVEDMDVGQVHIRRGEGVMCLLGSANRDPDIFKDPDTVDLSRKNNVHIAFGVGRHFCIGNQLARLEGQVAIRRVFDRFPHIRLLGPEPKWIPNFILRSLQTLPVSLSG
jgi:cytochrome P450